MTTRKKLSCPECGVKYDTAKGMATHRRYAHGVAGSGRTTIDNRNKKAAAMFKCAECDETFPHNRALGLHLRNKHGIQGTAKSTVAAHKEREAYLANYKRGADGKLLCPECGKGFGAVGITFHRKQMHHLNAAMQQAMFEQAKAQPDETATNEAQTEGVKCEQCDFVAKNARGLRTHVSHIHQLSQTANAIYAREKRNKTIEQPTQVIVAVQTTSNGNSNRHPENGNLAGTSISDAAIAFTAGRVEELLTRTAFEFDIPAKSFTARVVELIHAKTVR